MSDDELIEVAEKQLPNLPATAIAKILAGSLKSVLTAMGVSSKIMILHENATKVDPEILVEAIKRHTVALSYVVPKYGLTELYIKARIAEQKEIAESENEKNN